MFERVARTKTEVTAWKLIEYLTARMPWLRLVVVMRSPGSGFELVPAIAVHPEDAEQIKKLAGEFARQAQA